MEPSPPTPQGPRRCPRQCRSAHHALVRGLLNWRSHHCQDLGPKCPVGSQSLFQDLGGRQKRLASQGLGAGLAWGSQSLAHGKAAGENQVNLLKTSLMGDWTEQKNVGFGVGRTQVQTLALLLGDLGQVITNPPNLSFLPVKEALSFLPRA